MAASKKTYPKKGAKCTFIPEWSLSCFIIKMNGDQTVEYNNYIKAYSYNIKSQFDAAITLVAHCCVDVNGKRLFDNKAMNTLKTRSDKIVNSLIKEALDKNPTINISVKQLKPKRESITNDNNREENREPTGTTGKPDSAKRNKDAF